MSEYPPAYGDKLKPRLFLRQEQEDSPAHGDEPGPESASQQARPVTAENWSDGMSSEQQAFVLDAVQKLNAASDPLSGVTQLVRDIMQSLLSGLHRMILWVSQNPWKAVAIGIGTWAGARYIIKLTHVSPDGRVGIIGKTANSVAEVGRALREAGYTASEIKTIVDRMRQAKQGVRHSEADYEAPDRPLGGKAF